MEPNIKERATRNNTDGCFFRLFFLFFEATRFAGRVCFGELDLEPERFEEPTSSFFLLELGRDLEREEEFLEREFERDDFLGEDLEREDPESSEFFEEDLPLEFLDFLLGFSS